QITHAGPGSASHTGPLDYMRLSIGNFPKTSEFGGDSTATIGSVQGIVGAVMQPASVSPTVSAWFGMAGYAACQTSVGSGGSCTGANGTGVALASAPSGAHGYIAGLNSVVTNASQVSHTPSNSGYDYHDLTSLEVDINVMKTGGAAPHANAVGILIAGQ